MQLNKTKWSKKDYLDFIQYLKTFQDIKYRNFHKKILNTDQQLIGIRTPILKKIAKEISKGNYKSFISILKYTYYEESTIHGLILGYLQISIKELENLIDKFLLHNNNWATNDLTCSNLKIFKKTDFEHIYKYINSPNAWTIRFGLVIILSYYINEQNIDKILYICDNIKNREYYVQMAIAWTLSICFIKQKKQTYHYLLNNNLNNFTMNKTIAKIRDSYRVDDNDKEKLKKLRREEIHE